MNLMIVIDWSDDDDEIKEQDQELLSIQPNLPLFTLTIDYRQAVTCLRKTLTVRDDG